MPPCSMLAFHLTHTERKRVSQPICAVGRREGKGERGVLLGGPEVRSEAEEGVLQLRREVAVVRQHLEHFLQWL